MIRELENYCRKAPKSGHLSDGKFSPVVRQAMNEQRLAAAREKAKAAIQAKNAAPTTLRRFSWE